VTLSVAKQLAGRWRHFGLGALFIVATNAAANTIPWLMKLVVHAIEDGDAGDRIATLCTAIIAVAAVGAGVRVLSRILIFNGARYIEYDIRNGVFAHLLTMPPEYYQEQETGDLMSRVTNDVGYLRLMYGPGVLNVINTICAFSMALPLLIILDPWLTLWTLLPVPIMLTISRGAAGRIYRRQRGVQDQLASLTSRLHQNLSGIAVVKSHGLEGRENGKFDGMNEEYTRRSLSLVIARGLFMPLVGSIAGFGFLVLLFAGGKAVATGRISLGDLVAFMGYLGLLTWPTLALGWVITSWQRGLAAMARISEVVTVAPSIADPAPERATRLAEPRGALDIEGLTIAYGDGEPALTDVSASVAPGGSLGIVGRTGSGKTTLVHCLPRLLDIPEGTVRLDGVDITRLPLADLRSSIAFVPQDSFLFSTTLRANVAFAVAGEPEDEIREAMQIAGLAPDIAAFPDGLGTVVGERGITLSGGQRQRTAIARALLADRPVLVLDDALSSVDAETERTILDGLRKVAKGRTTVIVSHRLSAVAWCDIILALDAGRVSERGTHEELLEAGGWYADMWALQQANAPIGPRPVRP
jgi:ATP-binding cassette subfamily B multidrug efflux pump